MSDNAEKFDDSTLSKSSEDDLPSANDVSVNNNNCIPCSSKTDTDTKKSQHEHLPLTPLRGRKNRTTVNVENILPIVAGAPLIESFANEIMINIFKFLPRNVLDQCAFVNRRWNHIIDIHEQHFSRRCIDKLSIYADFNQQFINIWGCSLASANEIQSILDLEDFDGLSDVVQKLKYSKIKCLVLGTINLTEDIIHQLVSIFRNADAIVLEIQMRRIGLENITAPVFHEFCENINAERYGFSEMLQVQAEHFGNEFFNKKLFREAKYLSIKDVKTNEAVVPVNVDDDTLIDFLFGENVESVERKVACIEFPAISSQFVTKVLKRFPNQTDITHMVTEATLISCVRQTVLQCPQYQNILLGYANYESYNTIVKKELQVEVKKTAMGMVNVFLSVGERY